MRKNNLFKTILSLVIVFTVMASCKKDYLTGGTIHDVNMYKNTSSFDVLKKLVGYDTVALLIESAGYIDKVNTAGSTFFVPNNSAITIFLNARTNFLQVANKNAQFGLDSLIYYVKNNVKGSRDSLGMYIIPKVLDYNAMTNTGAKYATMLAGDSAVVSYEDVAIGNTSLGYNANVSSIPKVVYFTQMWYPYIISDAKPAGSIPNTIGARTLCSTSGMITQNGIMHFLQYGHLLFFNATKK